jgi:MYXO-CTERM domain-containing protein
VGDQTDDYAACSCFCDVNNDCPSGWDCIDIGNDDKACWPGENPCIGGGPGDDDDASDDDDDDATDDDDDDASDDDDVGDGTTPDGCGSCSTADGGAAGWLALAALGMGLGVTRRRRI